MIRLFSKMKKKTLAHNVYNWDPHIDELGAFLAQWPSMVCGLRGP